MNKYLLTILTVGIIGLWWAGPAQASQVTPASGDNAWMATVDNSGPAVLMASHGARWHHSGHAFHHRGHFVQPHFRFHHRHHFFFGFRSYPSYYRVRLLPLRILPVRVLPRFTAR